MSSERYITVDWQSTKWKKSRVKARPLTYAICTHKCSLSVMINKANYNISPLSNTSKLLVKKEKWLKIKQQTNKNKPIKQI